MMYEPASAAASTSAPPPSAPTPNDVDLLERLRLSEEWNLRLQAQLQEILRLPMNEVDVMRERMQNPDLAIPLLQCYDAAILEKSEQIAALKKELMHIHTQAEAATCDRGDLTQALRVAEEMTKQTQAQASAEVLKMDAAQRELRLEVSQLQQELARCMAMESEARMRAEKLEKTATEQQTTLETVRVEHTRVREELQLTQNRLRMREQVEGEGQLQTETQRVKLHLLTSENQERLQELERLRNQMTLALRQAADNHNAHLRVVEERHRMVLEEVRAANQTQELELLKLRAQLARIDPAGPLSNRGGGTLHPTNSSSLLHTTTELLDAQSRQAKDMELKRMYSEVASAQMQRDEAVQRWEQLTRNAKREMDHAMMDARREADQLRAKVEQERTRGEDAETEKDRLQQRVSEVEQQLRQAQSEVQQSKTECGTLRRQLAEMQREHGIHKMELDQSRAELRDTIAADQKRVGALEQRVAEVVSDLQSTTDRSATQVAAAERQRNAATENLRESELRVQKLKATIAEQVRQLEAGHLQQQHISEALETHKRDLQRCDQRVQQLQVQVEALRGERREYLLSLEQLKLENGRLVRACRESCRGSVADYATSRVVA